jgi:mono/diheme cytochrome c family protein
MRACTALLSLTFLASLPQGRAESLLEKAAKIAPPHANPYSAEPAAVQAGQKLFARECSACHGQAGRGNGRAHTPLLATPLVHQADPGTLFWILRNGSAKHRMPSFSHLPEQQRWQIVTYLKTLGDE